jgi:chemotaxis methyl-accepting protein methylase
MENVDLIMCRNLLIYFKRDTQLAMLRSMHRALGPEGCLVLGKTETLANEMRQSFKVVDVSEHVYQKAGVEPCGWR